MTTVLLTGAGGFVGHHLLEHLLINTDWTVVCIDSFRHKGKTDRIREVLDNGPSEELDWVRRTKVVTHDLNAPFSTQLIDHIGKVDAIISMAADSHVDRSISDPVPFIQNNVGLVLNLLEYARIANPRVFIQISTDEVYGPAPGGYAHKEWDAIIPSNPYAASKAAQEAIATSYWRTYDVPLIISNTMNIIGERQDPEKFIPMTIKKVLAGETVTIHSAADRTPGSRFYLHARNQADAITFLIRRVLQGLYNDGDESLRYTDGGARPLRYHVVGEREVDNFTMALMVAEAVGNTLNAEFVDFHSSRPGHDLRYALNGSKLADLGWNPPIPLDTSLKKTVEWTLAHPAWLKD